MQRACIKIDLPGASRGVNIFKLTDVEYNQRGSSSLESPILRLKPFECKRWATWDSAQTLP
jgi:hypothetical protein